MSTRVRTISRRTIAKAAAGLSLSVASVKLGMTIQSADSAERIDEPNPLKAQPSSSEGVHVDVLNDRSVLSGEEIPTFTSQISLLGWTLGPEKNQMPNEPVPTDGVLAVLVRDGHGDFQAGHAVTLVPRSGRPADIPVGEMVSITANDALVAQSPGLALDPTPGSEGVALSGYAISFGGGQVPTGPALTEAAGSSTATMTSFGLSFTDRAAWLGVALSVAWEQVKLDPGAKLDDHGPSFLVTAYALEQGNVVIETTAGPKQPQLSDWPSPGGFVVASSRTSDEVIINAGSSPAILVRAVIAALGSQPELAAATPAEEMRDTDPKVAVSHVLVGLEDGLSVRVDAINEAGWIAGTTEVGPDEVQAVLWIDGQLTEHISPPGSRFASSSALNERGQLLGQSELGDGTPQVFLWENGVATLLEPPAGFESSLAVALNNSGLALIYLTRPHNSGDRDRMASMLWDGSVLTALDLERPAGWMAVPEALNNAGDIAGWIAPKDGGMIPARWINGALEELGIPSGFVICWPQEINDAGSSVGFCAADGPEQQAVLWKDDAVVILPPLLDPGERSCSAIDINEKDQVVGWATGSSGGRRPVIWTNGSVFPLPLPDGFSQGEAVAINNQGQIGGTIQTPTGYNLGIQWEFEEKANQE